MFEDNKQHVFCDQKVLKLVIRIFANATINQKSMVTYTFSIWVAAPCLASAMKFVYCTEHCFKIYTPFIQWTIKFKHLTFDGTTVMLDAKRGHFVQALIQSSYITLHWYFRSTEKYIKLYLMVNWWSWKWWQSKWLDLLLSFVIYYFL